MSNCRTKQFLLLLCILFYSANVILGQATFEGLGDLPPDYTGPIGGSPFYSEAFGISGNGLVVVGHSSSYEIQGLEAFRWEDGVLMGLGDLPYGSFSSQAKAASLDGQILVGWGIAETGQNAAVWMGGYASSLPSLPGIPMTTIAVALTSNGEAIVGYGGPVGSRKAIIWQGGIVSEIGGNDSRFSGISSDGTIAAGTLSNANGHDEAFVWDGTITMLGELPGGPFQSEATGVSADGSVVVGWSSATLGIEAFRWSNGTMVGLGDLPGNDHSSKALAVSGDGSIIVGTSASIGLIAFVWDVDNGMRELKPTLEIDFGVNLTGWELRKATGISYDGLTITGTGRNPDGKTEAWIVRVPSWDPDCNGNGTPDFQEIASGTAADCNANQRIDSCDIAGESSADTNNNGIPDECESCALGCDDSQVCTADSCIGGLCEHTEIVPGDISPCGGNGSIDVDDILFMLDAFQGVNICGCPD